jgi:hypothetical protein
MFFDVVPPGIEPGYQVPETCILSVVLRDQLLQMYYIIETKEFGITQNVQEWLNKSLIDATTVWLKKFKILKDKI